MGAHLRRVLLSGAALASLFGLFLPPPVALARPRLAPAPSVSLSVPAQVPLGEAFSFTVSFDNTSADRVGRRLRSDPRSAPPDQRRRRECRDRHAGWDHLRRGYVPRHRADLDRASVPGCGRPRPGDDRLRHPSLLSAIPRGSICRSAGRPATRWSCSNCPLDPSPPTSLRSRSACRRPSATWPTSRRR